MKKFYALPVLAGLLFLAAALKAQVISITKPVFTYKQNFDSLANTGTSSQLPYGWYFYETGSGKNTTYTADSGASSTGDTYSYGHKGSTDRALGSLSTGSEDSYLGAEFKNNTGYSINSITVAFTIEQWRLGATGRQDSMVAGVTTLAPPNLSTGLWVGLPLLNMTSPVTTGTTGQLDGNNPANRKKISYTISGISVNTGSSIWLRWQDQNITGNNDGLAIDDFSLSVKAYIPHTIASSKFPQTNGIPDTTQTGLWNGVVLGPNYSKTGLNFQFKDNTGSITAISAAKTYGYVPAVGDSVAVYGQIQSSGYLTYILIDSVGKISSGKNIGIPKTVTSISSDTLESNLARINHLNLAPGYKWDTTGAGKNGGFMTTVTNGVNTYNVWISNSTNIYGKPAPKFPFNLVGIVLQNSTNPLTGYYLWPRTTADFDTIPLPLYQIAQVRGQNAITGVSDSANNGHLIFLKGVVQSPNFTTPGLQFAFNDNTGYMTAVSTTVKNYTPVLGDSVLVRGTMTQVNGETEITADSIRTLSKGSNVIKTPVVVTSLGEIFESVPVELKNAYIVNAVAWVPSGTYFMVKYTDGKDTLDVRIYDNTDLYKLSSPPAGNYNISGIGGQSKTSVPYTSGYQLWPRGLVDFQKILSFSPLPLYKIGQLKGYNAVTGVADSLNKGTGYIKGVVHDASFSATALQFSLIDNTGAITLFSNKIKYYTPSIGDSLLVHGTVAQSNGLTEYAVDSIIPLTKGTWLKTPTVVTSLGEATESDIIKINNVYITDTTTWVASGAYFNVRLSDGKDTFTMRVNSTVNLYNMRPLKGIFNIIGICSQAKSTSPYTSGYVIEPRGLSDFVHDIQIYKIAQVRGQNAVTRVADSITGKNRFLLKGIVQGPDFASAGLSFSIKDNTGSIFISASTNVNGYVPITGDSILVRGLIKQVNGLTQITVDSISKLTGASPVLNPQIILNLSEATEANLIKYNTCWLVDPTKWILTGASFNVNVTNGTDTITLQILNTTTLYGRPAPKGRFNITGIGSQSKSASPYIGGYFLIPRSLADVQLLPVKLYTIGQVNPYSATTGIADSINLYCFIKGVVESESLSANASQFFGLKDKTGAITVTSSVIVNNYIPNVGDSLEVRGTVHQLNGLTHFDMDSASKLIGGTAFIPIVTAALNETTESNLITLKGYSLVDTTKWDTTGGNGKFTVKAHKLTDTITLEIVKSTDLYRNSAKPHGNFNVTGLGSQNDPAQPYFKDYILIPRGIADFMLIPPPPKLHTIAQVKGYNKLTGIGDSIGVYCLLKGVVESGNLSANNAQFFPIRDNTGAITLEAAAQVSGYSPSDGDTVEARGFVHQTNGLIHLDIDSIHKFNSGPNLNADVILAGHLSDSSESDLISIYYDLYKLADSTKWDTTGSNGMFMVKAYDLSHNTDTVSLAIFRSTTLYSNKARPQYEFCITGIASQNDSTQPYLQDYFIIPRGTTDLINCRSGIAPENGLAATLKIYPNPASNQIRIDAGFRVDKLQLINVIGQVVEEQEPLIDNFSMDLSQISPGIYFIKINSGGQDAFRKVVKE